MRNAKRGSLLIALAVSTATVAPIGCGVMTVDVDVYKGPLANHKDIQLSQLADMALSIKPLLVQLRNDLEFATRYDTSKEGREASEDDRQKIQYPPDDAKITLDDQEKIKVREAKRLLADVLGAGYFEEGRVQDLGKPWPVMPLTGENRRLVSREARRVNEILLCFEFVDDRKPGENEDAAVVSEFSATSRASRWAALSAQRTYQDRAEMVGFVQSINGAFDKRRLAAFPVTQGLSLESIAQAYAADASRDREWTGKQLTDNLLVLGSRMASVANNEPFFQADGGLLEHISEGGKRSFFGETRVEAARRQYGLILHSLGNTIIAQIDAIKQEDDFGDRAKRATTREVAAAASAIPVDVPHFLDQLSAIIDEKIRQIEPELKDAREALDVANKLADDADDRLKKAETALADEQTRLTTAKDDWNTAQKADPKPDAATLKKLKDALEQAERDVQIAEGARSSAKSLVHTTHDARRKAQEHLDALKTKGDEKLQRLKRTAEILADGKIRTTFQTNVESIGSDARPSRTPTREALLWLYLAHLRKELEGTQDAPTKQKLNDSIKELESMPRLFSIQTAGAETARDILDGLIAQLRYEYLVAVKEYGEADDRTKQIAAALSKAYEQRSDTIFIRPASSYLRTSFAATGLQRDASLRANNMLGEQATKALPFYDYFQYDRGYNVLRQVDKQFWQNINTVKLSGWGDTNYVVAKDDVGNWYVKNYSTDPKPIIKSARNLALFSMGGTLGAGDAFKLVRDQDAAVEAADAARGTPSTGTQAGNTVFGKQYTSIVSKYDDATRAELADLKKSVDGLEDAIDAAWKADATLKGDAAAQASLKQTLTDESPALETLKTTKEADAKADAAKKASQAIAQAVADGKKPTAADVAAAKKPALPTAFSEYAVGNEVIDGLGALRAYRDALVAGTHAKLLEGKPAALDKAKSTLVDARKKLADLPATATVDETAEAKKAVAEAEASVTAAQDAVDLATKQSAAAGKVVRAKVDAIVASILKRHRASVDTLDVGLNVIGSSLSKP